MSQYSSTVSYTHLDVYKRQTVFDAAIGSSLLSGVVEHLTSISGGHASAGFWVGVGARLALGGSIAVLLASICLIWHARVAVNSTGGQPGMPAAVRPTPCLLYTSRCV